MSGLCKTRWGGQQALRHSLLNGCNLSLSAGVIDARAA